MANVIFQGSTPIIKYTPINGMKVADLGEPSIFIEQPLVFIEIPPEDITIDTNNNCIIAKLKEEDSLSLTGGIAANLQVCFVKDDDVYRFPVVSLSVSETIVSRLTEEMTENV